MLDTALTVVLQSFNYKRSGLVSSTLYRFMLMLGGFPTCIPVFSDQDIV